MSSENVNLSRSGSTGLVFVGCLLLGLAIGLLTGNLAVWLLGALGLGFIAMGIVRSITGTW